MNYTPTINVSRNTWTCAYSQHHIIHSTLYKEIILPILIPISIVTSFATSITNLIVIFTIVKTTYLHSPSNFIILGMAISDFGVGVFGQPLCTAILFYELYNTLQYYCQIYDVFYCLTWILGSTSLLTLCSLTTDRFIAVYSHLRYADVVNSRRVFLLLSVIWLYSIIGWFVYFFITKDFMIPHEVVALITIVMNIYFIIRINRCVRRHLFQIQAQQQAAQQSMNLQFLKRSINPMYYMFGAFVCCCFPYFAAVIALSTIGRSIGVIIAFKLSEFLFLLNSLANPMIYFWRIEALRTASYTILRNFCHKIVQCCQT